MYQKTSIAAALLLATMSPGCGDNLASPAPPDAPPEAEITYWQDVAPIFFQSCVTCHQQDGIAPFRLDSYAVAQEWATVAKQAVQERTMPPWQVTADGSCGEYRDSHWLDDADIETIAAWAESGAAEGTPRTDLAVPSRGPELDSTTGEILSVVSPNFVPHLQDGVDLAEVDEYRCFLIDPDFEQDRFITGYEVIPSNPARVHHVQIMVVNPSVEIEPGLTNGDLMQSFDDADPDRDGWPCFGLVGERVVIESFPVNWGAGQGVLTLPEESGSRVRAGSVFVLQVHYNLSDEAQYGQPVRTEVRVRVVDEVEREGFFAMPDAFIDTVFAGEPATLPVGMERAPYSYETATADLSAYFGPESFEVWGILPHMHYHGRSFSYDIVDANGDVQCGAEVNRWDPAWQFFYFYDQPLQLPPGSRVRTTCEFDTRGRTTPLSAGWGIDYEMCMTGLYLLAPLSP